MRRSTQIPPPAMRLFLRDLEAFSRERSPQRRNLIVNRQMHALWEHQRPGDRRVNALEVKELFHAFNGIFHALSHRR
jgi:hypothetical protein